MKLVSLDQGCCVAESWATLESFREELAWGSPASVASLRRLDWTLPAWECHRDDWVGDMIEVGFQDNETTSTSTMGWSRRRARKWRPVTGLLL